MPCAIRLTHLSSNWPGRRPFTSVNAGSNPAKCAIFQPVRQMAKASVLQTDMSRFDSCTGYQMLRGCRCTGRFHRPAVAGSLPAPATSRLRAWPNGQAPGLQPGKTGSTPVARTIHAAVAQTEEQRPRNAQVAGAAPAGSSSLKIQTDRWYSGWCSGLLTRRDRFDSCTVYQIHLRVAQPGSASAWGAEGRRFKSCRGDQPHTACVKTMERCQSGLMAPA